MAERKFQPGIVGKTNVVEGAVIPWFGEQLVNYTMLYDGSLGESGLSGANTCSDVTGGYGTYYDKNKGQSGSNCDFNSDSVYIMSNKSYRQTTRTMNKITLTGYVKLFARFDYTHSSNDMTYLRLGFHENATYNGLNNADIPAIVYGAKANSVDGIVSGKNAKIFDITDDSKSMYLGMAATSGKSTKTTVNVYGVAIVKPDDYNELCDIAGVSTFATVGALIADTTAISSILSNRSAVNFMVKRCTGDFMASFVGNSACLSLLESSPYKSIVQANEHWAKLLAMVA